MSAESIVSRRGVLRSLASVLGVTIGCLSPRSTTPAGSPESPTTGPPTGPAGPTVVPTANPSRFATRSPGAGSELDLQEANVVGVEVDRRDETVRFAVTLYHDDDGEPGYADWWQVETVGGNRIERRALLHPHSTAPFTRSEAFEVPAGVTCVIVRGHDQTHGYGGRAMLVDVSTGAARPIEQGSEPRQVDPGNCP